MPPGDKRLSALSARCFPTACLIQPGSSGTPAGMNTNHRIPWLALTSLFTVFASTAGGQQVKLITRGHDPYGCPRPGAGQQHVPLRTSFYLELGLDKPAAGDLLLPESVTITLAPAGGTPVEILKPGQRFAAGFSGWIKPHRNRDNPCLAVYATGEQPLRPATAYTLRVEARSREGLTLPSQAASWTFHTESAPLRHDLSFSLDPQSRPVRWHGGFFTGFCKPSFCTSHASLIDTYELMAAASREYPRAWRLQRDFWMTGMDDKPGLMPNSLPNVVRERETRRIVRMSEQEDGLLLKVEDFFGHEQYGIAPNRPLSEDYHPGEEVLIADGTHDARAKVLATDDAAGTVRVTRVNTPKGGWLLEYAAPPPTKEDPNMPGLFALGGCYLRKFKPAGTPCYYWGRLDHEWDLAYRRFGRRLMPNFADAPGDLSIDGRNWTTAKDYVQLHEVVRTMTDHLLERYGEACLDFVWCIFNEPDLGRAFWRSDWDELQKYYDYSTDAILRAFEDRGYDSSRVFIGGLELGGIFGVHLKLEEFLAHCSPRAEGKGALPLNAAFADRRLDGKRSRRVEDLCRAHNGKGAPCDFISIHAYNRSEMMAAKLAKAKEAALKIDPEYYEKLWVNSHESVPTWAPPPDPAASDSFLGNGYFPTWCADVAARQLRQAARDPRYAFGESILTFWPSPTNNFDGLNNCTRRINVDDNGDGRLDRKVLVPMPIFHFLNLLSTLGDEYHIFPEQTCGGHVVSGMASRTDRDCRVLVYAHHALDTESRSDRSFDIRVDLKDAPWPQVKVREYRFDRDHNSYFRIAQQLRDRPLPSVDPDVQKQVDAAVHLLAGDDRESKLQALQKLAALGPAARSAAAPVLRLIGDSRDEAILEAGKEIFRQLLASPVCYSPEEVKQVQQLSELRVTAARVQTRDPSGGLKLITRIDGNGAAFLVIEPHRP